jgi:solute:Na+ symporter, SSS family
MEFLQLIVALFYAPVFAAVLAGLFSRRTTGRGAFAGILLGVFAAFAVQTGYWMGLVHFGSQMTTNFYEAMISFSISLLVCICHKNAEDGNEDAARQGLVMDASILSEIGFTPVLAVLSAALLACCLALNVLWW